MLVVLVSDKLRFIRSVEQSFPNRVSLLTGVHRCRRANMTVS